MTRRFRLPAILSTAVVAATLALAPVTAANAVNYGFQTFHTKTQCLYSQDQLHKVGFRILQSCYWSAGYWIVEYTY